MLSRKLSKVFSLCLMMLIISSMVLPFSVFADINNIKAVSETDANVCKISYSSGSGISANTIGSGITGKSDKYTYDGGKIAYKDGTLAVKTSGEWHSLLTVTSETILVSPDAFKKAKKTDVNKAMRMFTEAMEEQGDEDAALQIMNDMQETDSSVSSVMLPIIFETTKGDMYSAYKITSPFLEVLSVVLGVGAVILILFLLFSTVMDLAYIGLPVWREAQAEKGNSGKHPFGVSYEALTTVKEIESGLGGGDGAYRNSYLLYFKRRALTYIILAICIMYLICGGLSGIIGFVLSLVQGITG